MASMQGSPPVEPAQKSIGLSDARPTLRVVTRSSIRPADPDQPPKLELRESEREFLEFTFRRLTRRERQVIFELCSGGTNEGVADRLGVALPTLRTHMMRLNQKLGTTSKSDVVRLVASELLDGYREGRITLLKA